MLLTGFIHYPVFDPINERAIDKVSCLWTGRPIQINANSFSSNNSWLLYSTSRVSHYIAGSDNPTNVCYRCFRCCFSSITENKFLSPCTVLECQEQAYYLHKTVLWLWNEWWFIQQGFLIYNYALSQFKEVSKRELLLGYIGKGYSGDHVLGESRREGGHLGRRERWWRMKVKRGQRMGK